MTTDYNVHQVNWADASTALSAVRRSVFIEEQGVPEELEWDDQDAAPTCCLHLLATSDQGAAIGSARLLINGNSGQIGRMAVLPSWRGQGVGRSLLDAAVALAEQRQLDPLWLNAQVSVIGFYERAGFRASGDMFMDAGIPHRRMHHASELAAQR